MSYRLPPLAEPSAVPRGPMPKMPHPNRLILPEEAVAYLGLDQQGLRQCGPAK